MTIARLTQLDLVEFKSFHGERLPLGDLTVLTGLNSSGKSNALDGLDVLSRIATGDEITEVLDGQTGDTPPVRGKAAGCAPHGSDHFTLGCQVEVDDQTRSIYRYEVTIRVRPEVRVIGERLSGPGPAAKSRAISQRDLIVANTHQGGDIPGIEVQIDNGKQGINPSIVLRDSRSVLTQVALRLTGVNLVERALLRSIDSVLRALRGVFELDPIPSAMRNYVSKHDIALKRDGSNISATIANIIKNDPKSAKMIVEAISKVSANTVTSVHIETTTLDDVMLALGENDHDSTPAREMSDGLLRFTAILTALQSKGEDLDVDDTSDVLRPVASAENPIDSRVLLVIEEIENGLHPSQSNLVLAMLQEAIGGSGLQLLLTTHSPAVLDALTGQFNKDIVVCYRDDNGHSRLSRITELEGYATAMAHGAIGELITRAQLVGPTPRRKVDVDTFAASIGAR